MRRIAVIGLAFAAALAWGSPAGAQDFPDLPGMDVARDGLQDGRDGGARPARTARTAADTRPAAEPERLELPADGAFDAAQDRPAQVFEPTEAAPRADADDIEPAAATTGARDTLPRTGATVLGFLLAGVALVAGGRMLLELAPRPAR